MKRNKILGDIPVKKGTALLLAGLLKRTREV